MVDQLYMGNLLYANLQFQLVDYVTIDGLSNAVFLAPDGLSAAMEAEPKLVDYFLERRPSRVLKTLQALGDQLHDFHKGVNVEQFREAVFNLALLERGSSEARTALEQAGRALRAVPYADFREAVASITGSRQMTLIFTERARELARAVFARSAFLHQEVLFPEEPRRKTPPRIRTAA